MSIVLPNLTIQGAMDGQGATWRRACRVRTTTAISVSTIRAGTSIDGVVLMSNDRVLVANNTDTTNGIYVVQSSGDPIRAEDYSLDSTVSGTTVYILEGNTLADTSWACTAEPGIVGTNVLTYTQTSGTGVNGDVNTNSAQALSNKTITDPSNNLLARGLWYGSGSAAILTYAASAPTAGQVLTATSSTAANWQTPTGSSVFGGEFTLVQPPKFSTTSASPILVTGSEIRFTTAGAGTYMITWDYQWNYTASGNAGNIEARINDESVGTISTRPSDNNKTARLPGNAVSFVIAEEREEFTASTYIYASVAGQTITIYNLKCYIFRVA